MRKIRDDLRLHDTDTKNLISKLDISDATFYKWCQKYGGLGPSELRKLKMLDMTEFRITTSSDRMSPWLIGL